MLEAVSSRSSDLADSKLPLRLGVLSAAAVVISNTVGSGIFTTSGFIARDVGSPPIVMGLWLAGGMLAMAGALSYGELGAMLPEAGGEYIYLREAYGPIVAYLSAWTSFVVGFSGAIAGALLAFVGYLRPFAPEILSMPAASTVAAIGILWTLTFTHAAGVRGGGLLQKCLAAITAGSIAALIAAAFIVGRGHMANFASSAPARGTPAVSLIFVLYSYSGWNAAAYLAGEIRDAPRVLPRALILGTSIVAVLYLGLNAMYLYALPIGAMSGVPNIAAKACTELFGAGAGKVPSAIIAVCILGSASAMILAGPQVYYAAARDGLFPRFVAGVHQSFGTPARALIVQSLWSSLLIVFFGAFEPLVIYTGFAITLFSALAVAALVILRIRRPDLSRPFRVPLYPWLPVTYVGTSSWIVIHTVINRPFETVVGAVVICAGLGFLFLPMLVSPRSRAWSAAPKDVSAKRRQS